MSLNKETKSQLMNIGILLFIIGNKNVAIYLTKISECLSCFINYFFFLVFPILKNL